MNKPRPSYSVAECKVQASVLLKSLHSTDSQQSLASAKRFQVLPEFFGISREAIINTSIKRKQALTVIAIEKGFKSWNELKTQLPFIRGGFLNQWFKNYEDAKAYLQSNGGFLLPFQNQFFVCEPDYMSHIGFNPNDSDWELIGWDWVKPKEQAAWLRLSKKWNLIQGGK